MDTFRFQIYLGPESDVTLDTKLYNFCVVQMLLYQILCKFVEYILR